MVGEVKPKPAVLCAGPLRKRRLVMAFQWIGERVSAKFQGGDAAFPSDPRRWTVAAVECNRVYRFESAHEWKSVEAEGGDGF